MGKQRVSITIGEEMAEWYKKESEKLAIPVSSVMTFALKQYMDTQRGLIASTNIPELLQAVKDAAQKEGFLNE